MLLAPVLPAPVLPVPVLLTPVLPAPVLLAPVLLAPVWLTPVGNLVVGEKKVINESYLGVVFGLYPGEYRIDNAEKPQTSTGLLTASPSAGPTPPSSTVLNRLEEAVPFRVEVVPRRSITPQSKFSTVH